MDIDCISQCKTMAIAIAMDGDMDEEEEEEEGEDCNTPDILLVTWRTGGVYAQSRSIIVGEIRRAIPIGRSASETLSKISTTVVDVVGEGAHRSLGARTFAGCRIAYHFSFRRGLARREAGREGREAGWGRASRRRRGHGLTKTARTDIHAVVSLHPEWPTRRNARACRPPRVCLSARPRRRRRRRRRQRQRTPARPVRPAGAGAGWRFMMRRHRPLEASRLSYPRFSHWPQSPSPVPFRLCMPTLFRLSNSIQRPSTAARAGFRWGSGHILGQKGSHP